MRLLLVRHAEASRGKIPIGRAAAEDLGLTPRGESQAQVLANHLLETREVDDCSRFVCSPLPRAMQTGNFLGDRLGLPTMVTEVDLSEIGNLPDTPGSGEPLAEFFARVHRSLGDLADRNPGQTVVAVTHGGWIMASIRVLFDIPTPGTHARFDPSYSSITEWSFSGGVWWLERYNYTPGRLNGQTHR